jgi:hypothetical protein
LGRAAAQHLSCSHHEVDFATDICVTMMLGGLGALGKAHGDRARTVYRSVDAHCGSAAGQRTFLTPRPVAPNALLRVETAA